jgi:hypothetical protein
MVTKNARLYGVYSTLGCSISTMDQVHGPCGFEGPELAGDAWASHPVDTTWRTSHSGQRHLLKKYYLMYSNLYKVRFEQSSPQRRTRGFEH